MYGGCVASILLGPLVLACYSIAAATLETKISEYESEIARLKGTAKDSSRDSAKLAGDIDANVNFITEEMVLTTRWKNKVDEIDQEYTEVFDSSIDLVQFIEINEKEASLDQLCSLSRVCLQDIEHKLTEGEYQILK